jgi:hypothetical protein
MLMQHVNAQHYIVITARNCLVSELKEVQYMFEKYKEKNCDPQSQSNYAVEWWLSGHYPCFLFRKSLYGLGGTEENQLGKSPSGRGFESSTSYLRVRNINV